MQDDVLSKAQVLGECCAESKPWGTTNLSTGSGKPYQAGGGFKLRNVARKPQRSLRHRIFYGSNFDGAALDDSGNSSRKSCFQTSHSFVYAKSTGSYMGFASQR